LGFRTEQVVVVRRVKP